MSAQHRMKPALALAALLAASPAAAEITSQTDHGFAVAASADVPARSAAEVWQALLAPAKWWSSEHSWSGDAANLTLDPQAGGCFCELLPAPDQTLPSDAPASARRGSVEHMRVIAVMPGKLLRLTGALGPLQGEALIGTLTITLKPDKDSTHVSWSYVVGGYMRQPREVIAPLVDKVLGEQLAHLAAFASGPGGKASADQPAAPAAEADHR